MITEWEMLLRACISILLGFCIGLERKMRFKEAGIRTHTIVCFGSALMMLVSKYAFNDIALERFDASRIASQIVSGIGFIGAGMIIYRKQVIHGLTTAAGVWATAGVGMAVGSGLLILAAFSALLLILVQWFLHLHFRLFRTRTYYQIRVRFEDDDGTKSDLVRSLFGVERFSRVSVERKDNKVICSATVSTDRQVTAGEITTMLSENDFIYAIERSDE